MNTTPEAMAPSALGTMPSQSDFDQLFALLAIQDYKNLELAAAEFIKCYPSHPFGYKARAASLTMLSEHQSALSELDFAVARFPLDAEIHANRAGALIQLGRYDEAITSSETAIGIDTNCAEAYTNGGLALKHLGYWMAALDTYRRAIELNPQDATTLFNMGLALIEMDLPGPAAQCFQQALHLAPENEEVASQLAIARRAAHFQNNACEEFETFLKKFPENDKVRTILYTYLSRDCNFDAAENHQEILLGHIYARTNKHDIQPLSLIPIPEVTATDQRTVAFTYAEHTLASTLLIPPLPLPETRQLSKILRVGYLSSDFHDHATAILLIGVLEARTHGHIEVFAYSYGRADAGAMRERLVKSVDTFRDIRDMAFVDAAQQIAADGIDILVDLKVFTLEARPEICTLRPAPIIINWLGYPGTVGHPRLADYIIGDPIVTPLEHQSFYSETIVQLPHCYQPTDNHREIGLRPPRAECALPEGAFVFCSFNQSYKIKKPVFQQWCRILHTVPNSVLWLYSDQSETQNNLWRYAEAEGIARERLIFAPQWNSRSHLGRLQLADLALDTFPYGSHTTGSDALWAGVPLVAICGQTFASRVSASLLTSAGLPELITHTPEEAADLAIELALDQQRLQAIRQKLQKIRLSTPLFDTARFARTLERLYVEIWHQHSRGVRTPILLSD